MNYISIIAGLLLLVSIQIGVVDAQRTRMEDFSSMRGANYVPSYARNDVQIWLDYDPAVIDKELGYAEQLKLNTVRVFLQEAVYEKQPEKFLADFESFLALCDKHHLRMMPVLFDSCFDPQVVDLENYREKDWMPCPGFDRLGMANWPAMQRYLADVIGAHKQDPRIALWDVMNEPDSTAHYRQPEGRAVIDDFLRRALKQVRADGAAQPLGIGWSVTDLNIVSIDLCDVILAHNYADPAGLVADMHRTNEIGRLQGKPVILSEFADRRRQHVEQAIPIAAKENIGWCFWELMLGNTQFSKGKNPYQGHIYPDGTCYSTSEVAAIMNPAGFEGNADDFAAKVGFKVSDRVPKEFVDEGITFSPLWERWTGAGPAGNRLWYASDANQTATKTVTGTSIELVTKHGPDCGIAAVTIDGKPIASGELDTYGSQVDWDSHTLIADGLSAGSHTVVITVTGRKAAGSGGTLIQIVDIVGR